MKSLHLDQRYDDGRHKMTLHRLSVVGAMTKDLQSQISAEGSEIKKLRQRLSKMEETDDKYFIYWSFNSCQSR